MSINNILQQVQTYQPSELAFLQNLNCFISDANKKFQGFESLTANLGTSVNMELPYRFTTSNGLVAVDQAIVQRAHPLTVDQSANVSMEVTNPEQIFNLDKDQYMNKIGKAAIRSLGAKIEQNIALNATSDVAVMIPDPAHPNYYIPSGAYHIESGPYRFYGDGVTPLNSFTQLAQMIANWRVVGSTTNEIKVYLPSDIIPSIVGTGLSQFAPKRNDEIAMSWDIGAYGSPEVLYRQSNLLPTHIAGSVGNGATATIKQLTVVSTNDPTGQNVTQITCTCDASLSGDVNAIKRGDLAYFVDGVAGFSNMRALTFTGNAITNQPVQFRITADAAAVSTTVVLNIVAGSQSLGLVSAPGATQNINQPIQAGMKIQVLPSHRAGLLVDGDALFVAMPRLPDQRPFDTMSENDKETGASLRLTYGALLGQNLQRLVHDCIWASTVVPEYCLRIVLPL